MATLGLRRYAPRMLFREAVETLRKSPLGQVVRTWIAWEGHDGDFAAPGSDALPWVRLTPDFEAVDWYSPEARAVSLIINVEAVVPGSDADDILDFWGEVFAVFASTDNALRLAMSHSKADTGEVRFRAPRLVPPPEGLAVEGGIYSAGAILITGIQTGTLSADD